LAGQRGATSLVLQGGLCQKVPLIRHLVDDDGSFFSCSDCDGELQRLESASENEPVPLPARFRLDFGLRSDLPEPTVVEKAAIAINRMYGKVVKIKHNIGRTMVAECREANVARCTAKFREHDNNIKKLLVQVLNQKQH
jgi:hypothetical protein